MWVSVMFTHWNGVFCIFGKQKLISLFEYYIKIDEKKNKLAEETNNKDIDNIIFYLISFFLGGTRAPVSYPTLHPWY